MTIGEINIPNAIINLEFQTIYLSSLIDDLYRSNPNLKFPDQQKVKKFQLDAQEAVKKKYPNSGITF